MHGNGSLCVQDALQQRMAVQEASVLQLKQELLRTSMNRDELARQNVSMGFCVCVLCKDFTVNCISTKYYRLV